MNIGRFELDVTGPNTAYLRLPTHPGKLQGAHGVPLTELMGAYKGPYVVLDFDQDGVLVGIEVVNGSDNEETAEHP
jgi:hypothetical protein